MEKIKQEAPDSVLVVDSGDLFFGHQATKKNTKWALKKALVISQTYKHMNAAAINVGDLDLQGLDFLRQEAQKGLPLISANLIDSSTDARIFSPYVVVEVSGARIALFGLLSSELSPLIQQAISDKAIVKDPVETAKEVLAELRGQADLIVLLSDLGLNKERDLIAATSGIHFVMGGHDGRMLRWPHKGSNTYIFQSYKKGMYVGNLHLIFSDVSAPFHNAGDAERIRQEIKTLDRRLYAIEQAKKRNPDEEARFDRTIKQLISQKNFLQKQLELAEVASTSGNRFLWTLESLRTDLTEDKQVLEWIRKTGLTKD